MIVNTKLEKDQKGNIKSQKSNYNPSQKVKNLTAQVMKDFAQGYETMHKSYKEFNDTSLLERMRLDQKSFNAYREPQSNDPDDAWKSNAFRPIVRNKVISIAAHITGSLIFPNISAQNENDEEDKDAAQVMKDLNEWAGEQANYEKTFLYSVIAALVNPAVIVHTQYAETYRTIKEVQEDGSWKEKEVLDEAFSGFVDELVPLDELFISDIYQEDIQKQSWLIRRQAIDFSIATAEYDSNENFKKYVRPGIQVMFDEASDSFYEQHDENLKGRLVEKVTYYNRSKDLQLCFINGVLVTDPDQPNPRQDKKYPFAKTGYETFDEGKFFYYKSLVFKMGPDEEVINTGYRMAIDGSFLAMMPPVATFGNEGVNTNIWTPGTQVHFKDKEAKFESLRLNSDLSAGWNMIDRVEASLAESSASPRQAGQDGQKGDTAFEISREEMNARIMLGLTGKMIGFLVKQFGDLRVSDILQYLTVGAVNEISSDSGKLKFRSFLVPNKTENGKTKAHKIDFDLNMPDEPVTEEYLLEESFKIQELEGEDVAIFKVNPTLFRRRKFMIKVTLDVVTPPSDNVKKALNLEAYDRLIANPLANQEAALRDLLLGSYETTKHDADKYIMKPEQMMGMMGMPQQPPMGGMAQQLANPGRLGSSSEMLSKTL